MGGVGRLIRIVILAAVALALVLTVALPPPTASAATVVRSGAGPWAAETEPSAPASLVGRWRSLPSAAADPPG
jgi:hypothetical protein